MEGFSAPSFSLGFDDDTQPQLQAPSFSLGLDLDLDYADLPTEGEESDPEPAAPADDLEDFDAEPCPGTLDPNLDDRPPALKRLRRGSGPPPRPDPVPDGRAEEGRRAAPEFMNVDDDDIEEFSSQEERRNQDESTSFPSHVACRSSKLSLHSRGLLTSQQAEKPKDLKVPPSKASTSGNIGTSSNLKSFPELTISPIRKFCLVDSDSDDPSSDKDMHKDTKDGDACLRQFKSSQSATRNDGKERFLSKNVQPDSFWKETNPEYNTNLATPVLDEFCEEYFRSVKGTKTNHTRALNPDDYQDDLQEYGQQKVITRKTALSWNSPNPQPPAYQYFNHDVARIQALIRQRLCYFVPIGAEKHTGNQHPMTENLDYMAQFGTNNAPSQARGIPRSTAENSDYMSQFGTAKTAREKGEGSSRKRGRKPKMNKAKQALPSDEGWVNPKSNIGTPKDAGKRRVSADVNKSGRWFTGENGRKVYVSKNGQEMTGRAAYTHYRKESCGGFKKSKKKAAAGKRKR